MKGSGTRGAIAALVTIAGVVVILAFNASRQREQTTEAGRQWIGEQWDIARDCLTGTPIGRGESSDAIAARLERRAIEAVVEASDRRVRASWPARCVSILGSLRADRSVLRADPGDAIARLEVLAPRVIGDAPIEMSEVTERARELADAIAVLDRAMPSGAAHDPEDHREPDLGMPAGAILASMNCPAPPQAASTTCRAGDVEHALIASESESGSPEVAPPPLTPALSRERERGPSAAWRSTRGGVDLHPPVALTAPRGASLVACDERGIAVMWRERATWHGAICAGDRCAPIAPLRAGADLHAALRGDRLIVVAPGARADLPLARVLSNAAWSDPVPVGRGAVSSTRSAFRIETCRGAFESRDGMRWRAGRATAASDPR